MDAKSMGTGWFGVPGKMGGMVHLVSSGKPVCGTRLAEGSQYQWCSPRANLEMVECRRCRKIGAKELRRAACGLSEAAAKLEGSHV